MEKLYGEQSHINEAVILHLAKLFPELFLISYDDKNEDNSHLIILPFNKSGLEKITDDNTYEEELLLSDFSIDFNQAPTYFFVYSIYGKTTRLSAQMIKQTYSAVLKYSEFFNKKESFIFAEAVTPAGKLISSRMGLTNYQTYIFDGEELFLYRAFFNEFIERNTRPFLSN